MRTNLVILLLGLFAAASVVAEDAYYQESIDENVTLRTTRLDNDSGVVYWEATLPGNSEFGQPTSLLSFVHSVIDITPPLLPDGVVERVRLKLFLRNSASGDLVVMVDSVDLDNLHRRHFLIGPNPDDSIGVQESELSNGEIEVVLTANDDSDGDDNTFVLYGSVLDVVYTPALPMDVAADGEPMPEKYLLNPNYPNPFNPSTTIEYNLPSRSHVRVEVLNLLGQTIQVLVDDTRSAGPHQVVWEGHSQDGKAVASGIYYYRIVAGEFINARKMILLK